MEENGICATPSAATADAAPDSTPFAARSTRRALMTNALTGAAIAAGAGAILAGCGSGGSTAPAPGNVILPSGATPTPSPTATPLDPNRATDFDILNFALNLEYLEAEFYLRAIGQTLTSDESGGSNATVTGGRAVNFTSTAVQQYAQEIANDERNHVRFLRSVLGGNAVAKPNINFTDAFNAAAQAAGIGSSFDPFADQNSFIIGAFVFEDVGVTAYKGAARYIDNKAAYLGSAAGILTVEAVHAGVIRHLITDLGGSAVDAANRISALRAQAGGGKDQGVTINGVPNYVPAQNDTVVYSRTFAEVLRIVYLTPSGTPASGGFFPNGVNGNIRVAA